MDRTIAYIIKSSRPRFWLYLAGPFLIGLGRHIEPLAIYGFFYFLIPANIYLYGVNDLADYDTDSHNDKKTKKEVRTTSKKSRTIITYAVIASTALSLPLFIFGNSTVQLTTLSFLILATLYSMPPARFKALPIIDFASNVLYIFPGLVAYGFVTNQLPSSTIIIAGALWTWAMHLYSAIPDIEPDKKAGIQTSAVFFGKDISLLICTVFWLGGILLGSYIHTLILLLGIIYPIIPLVLYFKNARRRLIEKVYWYFPFMNGILGFSLYLLRILS